jgi:hypothetical protein
MCRCSFATRRVAGRRGTNENTNLLLRQYFPRGTDPSGYSQAQLDQVALRLNQRPRRVNCTQVLRRPSEPARLTRQVELLPKNVLICAWMWLGEGFLMLMFVKWALDRSAALYLLSSADGSTAQSAIGS